MRIRTNGEKERERARKRENSWEEGGSYEGGERLKGNSQRCVCVRTRMRACVCVCGAG